MKLKDILRVSSTVIVFGFTTTDALASKVALVIGNSEYEAAGYLRNPVADAGAMAEKLRAMGFEIVEGYDLDKDGMDDTIDAFSEKVLGAEMAVFFYAGHGISVDGVNYVVPTDARMDHPVRWKRGMVELDEIMDTLSYADGPNVVFMDACRDNPLAETLARTTANANRSVSPGRGLSRIDPADSPAGTAIAFATAPGNVAQDGEGRHSPFTSALLNHIAAPNVSIADIMTRVTGEVIDATGGTQEPWLNMSLRDPLVLNAVATAPPKAVETQPSALAAAPVTNQDREDEKFIYDIAQQSDDINDYRTYLELYPNGRYAKFALNAISRLEQATTATTTPAETPEADTGQTLPESVVAAANPSAVAQPEAANTRAFNAALRLEPTTVAMITPSTQATEQALFLDRAARVDVQNRLNAMQINVGYADGSIGPNSRRGISAWQTQNGFVPTGYLNSIQYQMLVANSETVLATYLASRPTGGGASRPRANNVNSTVNSFFHGLGTGIGNALGRK